jgi:molybdopterin synthase sulfur carrier subunit
MVTQEDYARPVPTVRLFASAREAAGTGRDHLAGTTVAEVLGEARRRYGTPFAAVLPTCRVWVNGEPAGDDDRVADADEVAILPPVSGGALTGSGGAT